MSFFTMTSSNWSENYEGVVFSYSEQKSCVAWIFQLIVNANWDRSPVSSIPITMITIV